MSITWKKVAKILAEGLAYSARTTAMHEGMSWDSGARLPDSAAGGGGSGHHGRLSAPQASSRRTSART